LASEKHIEKRLGRGKSKPLHLQETACFRPHWFFLLI